MDRQSFLKWIATLQGPQSALMMKRRVPRMKMKRANRVPTPALSEGCDVPVLSIEEGIPESTGLPQSMLQLPREEFLHSSQRGRLDRPRRISTSYPDSEPLSTSRRWKADYHTTTPSDVFLTPSPCLDILDTAVRDTIIDMQSSLEPSPDPAPPEAPKKPNFVFEDAILRPQILKMMFVSGETGDVSPETTSMIEGIVQQQVMEMLKRATELAARRGVRTISTDDLIFLIRHDKAKVSRLRTFLSWKDVRKSAKDSDEKGGGGADAGGVDDFDLGANDPTLGTGPSVGTRTSKTKKAKVGLPWDVSSFYSEQVPEREDEEDEEEEEMNAATLQRLKQADERTKGMNAEEYLHFSECRQASFTFRKGKRFREWAGFGVVTDSKPNDDIVDILGFLTYEIVTLLTEEALKVKSAEDALKRDSGGDEEKRGKKRRREAGLFDPPEEARTPVGPKHIQEAYRRLQKPELKARYMSSVPKGNWQRPLKLI